MGKIERQMLLKSTQGISVRLDPDVGKNNSTARGSLGNSTPSSHGKIPLQPTAFSWYQ